MSALPNGWVQCSLGDIGRWSSGGTPSRSKPEYYGSDVPWVKTGDLRENIITEVPEGLTEAGIQNSAAKVFPSGTLLVAMYGATIGRTALLGVPAATNQACAALVAEGATPDVIPYVWKYLFSITDHLKSVGQGGAQPNISQEILKAQPIPLPPLAEQRRIVAKLDSLTARTARSRAELDHIPRLVEKYKQAILAKAFSGGLTKEWRRHNPKCGWDKVSRQQLIERRQAYVAGRRGSRLKDAPDLIENGKEVGLPGTWIAGCFADVSDLRVGYAFKSDWFSKEGVRLVRGANVSVGKLTWDDERRLDQNMVPDFAEYALSAGDIVVAMDRPLISSGLKAAVVGEADKGALLVQRVASPVPTQLIRSRYLWAVINSQLFIGQIEKHATGTDLPHISGNDILTTPIPLPPVLEQDEIARRVEAAFAWLDKVTAEHARASHLVPKLDQSILAKAFRGELVPQDPNDEPASVLLERIKAASGEPKTTRGGRGKRKGS